MVLAVKKHKIRRGEELGDLAKKYRIKKWEDIWNHRDNAKLKQKRKLPRNVQPNDVVVIPFTDKEKAELLTQKAVLYAYKVNDWRIEQMLLAHADQLEKSAKLIDKEIKDNDAFFKRLAAREKAHFSKLQRVADTVDIAAQLLLIGKDMSSVAKAYKKALKKSKSELEKVNKEAMEIAKKFATDGVGKISAEARKKAWALVKDRLPEELRVAVEMHGVLNESWDNLTKPSFWASTTASLLDGKGWSEAASRDLKSESESRIAGFDRTRMEIKASMQKRQKDLYAAAKRRRDEARATAFRIKVGQKLLDALPSL